MAEGRQWNIRQVYLYLVCFATLMMLIIGLVQLIMGVVDLIYPDPNIAPRYLDTKMRVSEMQRNNPSITQEDLEKQIQEENERQVVSQKYYQVKRFINSLALVVVSLPVYLYHWRKIQRGGELPT